MTKKAALPRFFALFLSLCIGLPPPAHSLRPTAGLESSVLRDLEGRLKGERFQAGLETMPRRILIYGPSDQPERGAQMSLFGSISRMAVPSAELIVTRDSAKAIQQAATMGWRDAALIVHANADPTVADELLERGVPVLQPGTGELLKSNHAREFLMDPYEYMDTQRPQPMEPAEAEQKILQLDAEGRLDTVAFWSMGDKRFDAWRYDIHELRGEKGKKKSREDLLLLAEQSKDKKIILRWRDLSWKNL